MKTWLRKAHMGPFGMILAMVDTARGRALVYNWRYVVPIAIVALATLWYLLGYRG